MILKKSIPFLFIPLIISLIACSGTFTDSRDSKTYKKTTIGTQVWMAENLNYETTSDSYCYDDHSTNCDTYGRLYIWSAAMNGASSSSISLTGVQGVCPAGWHLPSDAEWRELSDYVIANSAGTSTDKIGPYLESTSRSATGNGTDAYGFSGLPGGYRDGIDYRDVGGYGHWWSSSTEFSSSNRVYFQSLSYNYDYFIQGTRNKNGRFAFSVRCLQDTP